MDSRASGARDGVNIPDAGGSRTVSPLSGLEVDAFDTASRIESTRGLPEALKPFIVTLKIPLLMRDFQGRHMHVGMGHFGKWHSLIPSDPAP